MATQQSWSRDMPILRRCCRRVSETNCSSLATSSPWSCTRPPVVCWYPWVYLPLLAGCPRCRSVSAIFRREETSFYPRPSRARFDPNSLNMCKQSVFFCRTVASSMFTTKVPPIHKKKSNVMNDTNMFDRVACRIHASWCVGTDTMSSSLLRSYSARPYERLVWRYQDDAYQGNTSIALPASRCSMQVKLLF